MNFFKKNIHIRIQWWFWATIFLTFFLSELIEKSMYVDGVWYAAIARNLSFGKGSFWFPQFSETIFFAFHEHPPLMFWLQSCFFDFFGNHWLTERAFCLVQYCATSILIVCFWRRFLKHRPRLKQMWVIPLLFWQVNLASYYFLPANLLENSLVIFDLIAIWFLFRFVEHQQNYFQLFIAACFLVLSALTKGLTGLFPLAFLGIYWLVFRSQSIAKVFYQTSLLIILSIMIFGMFIWSQPMALESLLNYWDVQVLASLKGTRRLYFFRENRFYILGQMGLILIPMLLVVLLNLGIIRFWKKKELKIYSFIKSYEGKLIQVFFLLGLSASLPIIISPRQALPYLLPSLPFFCLAFGVVVSFLFADWWFYFIRKQKKCLLIFEKMFVFSTIAAFVLCIHKYGVSNHRDKMVIHDAEKIGRVVGENKTIASNHYDMYISGYLMRFSQISLDTVNFDHQFLILPKEQNLLNNEFSKIPIETFKYNLFERKAKHR